MSKPWIMALWVFTIAFTAYLFWYGQTAAAFGMMGATLSWEVIHRLTASRDTN
jgi:hypothetical protein